ncbi:MAG: Gfo/Idh/MocA family oxidoreductase [Planctomycetota bacterium]
MSALEGGSRSEGGGEPLRVAVCGAGRLGTFHARIYREHEGATLTHVVDPDQARATALALELGATALTDFRDLPEDVEAVSVATPTTTHADVACPLLERGTACLIEKPLAQDVREADRILAAAEKGQAILAVGHVERFQPGVRRVHEMNIEPRFIECHRLAPFSFRSMDIGVVHDLMIHDLDLVLHFMRSEVETVDAAGGQILTDHEDVASVRLVFANGARANVTASRASLKPLRRFRMFSSAGYVSLDFGENHGLAVRKGPNWDEGREELRNVDPVQLAMRPDFITGGVLDVQPLELGSEQRPLQAELDAFIRVARGEGDPHGDIVSGEDGRRALRLADRIAAAIADLTW